MLYLISLTFAKRLIDIYYHTWTLTWLITSLFIFKTEHFDFLWYKILTLIKNVSSFTSHNKNSVFTSFRLSLGEFKKILPNTFFYESILIKIYINANIMNTQIFHLIKYDLNGHWRSQKVTFMFILTLTYVLMDNFLSLF